MTVFSLPRTAMRAPERSIDPDAALMKQVGVHVGVERWAAQGVTPPHAISISGTALALRETVRASRDGSGRVFLRRLVRVPIGSRVQKT
jgi:hypothetical protein